MTSLEDDLHVFVLAPSDLREFGKVAVSPNGSCREIADSAFLQEVARHLVELNGRVDLRQVLLLTRVHGHWTFPPRR